MLRPILILVSFASMMVSAASTSEPARPLRIATSGDSTMCEYPADRPGRGWGHYVEDHFRADTVKVFNTAADGRSAKTFIQEGRWEKTLQEKPDYVFIQFGHNDSHQPANRESTDPATTFKEYLPRSIDESRAAGATPILVTPMVRRKWDEAGKFSEAPPNPGYRVLGTYAAAVWAVGTGKKVPVIDLYASSMALVSKLGPVACLALANSPTDNTHFNEKGARTMADRVLRERPAAAPDLAKYLDPKNAAVEAKRRIAPPFYPSPSYPL
ncbi:MAG: Rhamnogalacturonan acetylesterase RhgT [Verrucomicrobiota bacterium]|jgi:lysophospholipase L1-like esterase